MAMALESYAGLEGLNVLIYRINGEIEKSEIVFEKEFRVLNQRVCSIGQEPWSLRGKDSREVDHLKRG